ncbi:deoxyribodipyrimidine photo-lyase [Olivibacter sp. CPCC 100613]|uniref:cryptochrome/photolyase family protein n=1 Tax=Olivibacter sp. CPCC 100613 TaxID=3079931 RepID=UPI002FF867CC
MHKQIGTCIFWFRRDLRLRDNHALYEALRSGHHVQPVFIFDRTILSKLEDKDDARVSFIHQELSSIHLRLGQQQAAIAFYHDEPLKAWKEIVKTFNPIAVYFNHDYEPYARKRDKEIRDFLKQGQVAVYSFKDQVIFEKEDILKNNDEAYTVFTPYKNCWLAQLASSVLKNYPSEDHLQSLSTCQQTMPSLQDLGFTATKQPFPSKRYKKVIADYHDTRDNPSDEQGTSRLSVHLRFGTVSIRTLVQEARKAKEKTWLNELIWREFYMMILWHFPQTVGKAFKPAYDRIQWQNKETEFDAWCQGKTGYPLVDAGMRQLNETGFMHNRVRMVAASFLCKHLLIDWRWGEAYFARKLQDYEQSSNIGNWQWAAGSGNDAAPYFRIFNPELQLKKFDPKLVYARRWIPELDDPFKYPSPIVEHKKARERALEVYKNALRD